MTAPQTLPRLLLLLDHFVRRWASVGSRDWSLPVPRTVRRSTTASFAGNSRRIGVDAAEDRGEVAGGYTGGGGGVAVHGAVGGGAWHPAGGPARRRDSAKCDPCCRRGAVRAPDKLIHTITTASAAAAAARRPVISHSPATCQLNYMQLSCSSSSPASQPPRC